jgi:hypothetical protein
MDQLKHAGFIANECRARRTHSTIRRATVADRPRLLTDSC